MFPEEDSISHMVSDTLWVVLDSGWSIVPYDFGQTWQMEGVPAPGPN